MQLPANMWSPPPAKEQRSASVVAASLELDIRLVEDAMARVLGTLKKGQEPHEVRGYLERQLEELAEEKARYKERKLTLLEKIVPNQPSHKRSLSVPRTLSSLANVAAPPGDVCVCVCPPVCVITAITSGGLYVVGCDV